MSKASLPSANLGVCLFCPFCPVLVGVCLSLSVLETSGQRQDRDRDRTETETAGQGQENTAIPAGMGMGQKVEGNKLGTRFSKNSTISGT